MKRKIVCIVLVLLLCFFSCSFAEPFEIRNGIKFGMGNMRVLSIERENGNDISSVFTDKEGVDFVEFNSEVAGYDDCKIGYYFFDNKLKFIKYQWKVELKKSELTKEQMKIERNKVIEQYNTFSSVLENKYDKIGYLNNDDIIYTNYSQENTPKRLKMDYDNILFQNEYNKINGFSQFLVEDSEGYIEIIAYLKELNSINGYLSFKLEIDYRFIDNEIMEKINNTKLEKENKLNSDL